MNSYYFFSLITRHICCHFQSPNSPGDVIRLNKITCFFLHRLNGKEDEFFVPYDLEISLEELTYICRKSEQWRGEEGERRKVAVYDYVWEEEEVWPSSFSLWLDSIV